MTEQNFQNSLRKIFKLRRDGNPSRRDLNILQQNFGSFDGQAMFSVVGSYGRLFLK
jgi:hypothetical protein